MQTKAELEKWYEQQDPWAYLTHPDDQTRKAVILEALAPFGKFDRALDIGCGEGFITRDLPARVKHGLELSDLAADRLPPNVKRVKQVRGQYDLIVCTGMLYQQYDYKRFTNIINKHASNIVLTSNIKEWEINDLPADKQFHQQEFKYREYTQILRLYKF